MNHAERLHDEWSASASDRRWACPGSLALEQDAPPDKESHAAAWGTACHEVAEHILRKEAVPRSIQTKSHTIEVDDEVEECALAFVSYVTGQLDSTTNLLIEQKFSLAAIDPPFRAGGTGDAVLLKPALGEIEVVDLKTGRGHVVEVLGNKQLRTYGLGAILANPGPWKQVKVTIVQPRAPHKDGRIRSETFDVVDLMDWTSDLLDAMGYAYDAQVEWKDPPRDGWVSEYLTAGEHCTFCRAAPTCPALGQKALAEARVLFTPQGVQAPPDPETMAMDQIVRVLDHADMIQNWLNAVRAYAQDQAELGVDVSNGESTYVLTPKRAMRKWKLDDPVGALSLATGRDEDEFYGPPKPLSPAQVEKVLGKKGYEAVKDLVVQESSGFNLVRSDKTTKPAVLAPPKQFFQPQGE